MFYFTGSALLYAQENNCNDGIDNDLDGLIDEYDEDCCDQVSTFYDPCTSTNCSFLGDLPEVDLSRVFESNGQDYSTFCTPVFGDIDGDGETEIVVFRHDEDNNSVDIINGTTFLLEERIDIDSDGDNRTGSIALGDILDAGGDPGTDGNAEIVISVGSGTVYILRQTGQSTISNISRYDIHRTVTNVLLNINNIPQGAGVIETAMAPNIVDFDQDGIPEIYCGFLIIDPAEGVIMNSIPTGGLGAIHSINQAFRVSYTAAGEAVADTMIGQNGSPCGGACNGLELIAGRTVYAVEIDRSIPTVPTATLTAVNNALDGQANDMRDGFTSIADWDNDGDLDAIITTINAINDQTELYVWDLQTTTVMGSASTGYNYTGTRSIGRANIGDLDGDGEVEAVYCQNLALVAINNNYTSLWGAGTGFPYVITTDGSGATGASMFDFNADGQMEVVYRDEDNLRIINGLTGVNIQIAPCISSTTVEHPTIGDIDGNGTTEVLTVCDINTTFSSFEGRLVAFNAANTPWAPSRSVWNQANYSYTNINDDLSVPVIQQNHYAVQPLNSYINQYSDTLFRVPDATGSLEEAYCDLADGSIVININVSNIGDRLLGGTMPISVYNSNPLTATSTNPAILLGTIPTPLTLGTNLLAGGSTTVSFNVPSGNFTGQYFILLNDNGGNAGVAANFPYNSNTPYSSNIGECDYTNNLIVVDHPSCCFAAASPDYTSIDPAPGETTVIISGFHEIWPDKVYIPDGVTVIVENSAILDITNSDVVFGVGAGIDVRENAQLLAYNSVFRPCDDSETWRGIAFVEGLSGIVGSIKECTFINAEVAIDVVQDDALTQLAEVELKNNLFTNCYLGLRIDFEIAGPDIQVSGNTFEWGDWDHITYNTLPAALNFLGIELIKRGETSTVYVNPITQNSFANNTNYGSTFQNHSVGGILVHAGNADMDASNNQFTNLDYAFKVIADSEFGNPKISFENNFIEVTRRSNKDVLYQIEITRAEPAFSTVAYISGNTIVNSAVVDETLLSPTAPFFSNTLIGTGAIYSNNSAHIVDNYIRGFEVGIFADGGASGDGTQPTRISNNKIESFVYGIYRRGFTNVMHTIITCNEVDMKQMQDRTSINSIGICYQIDVATMEDIGFRNYTNPSLGFISDNCVSNTDMAIQIVNSSNVAGGNRLPPSLHVENNFMQNYYRTGFDIHDFEQSAAVGQFVRRNTFFSNNKGNGAIDIGRTVNFAAAAGTAFDIHGNDYGTTAVAWTNVNLRSNNVEPSSATCSGQDAGEDNILNFVDCNDEDILGETLTPTEMANSMGGASGVTTEPSGLPFPVLGQYTSQAIVRDAELNANELYVFPNPANNALTISFDNLLKGAKVLKVYNAQGQIVKTIEFSDTPAQKTISVEELTVGVYEIVLLDSRGLAGTSKFVKR